VRIVLAYLFLLTLSTLDSKAQRFDFSANEAVKVPKATVAQICHYIEVEEGHPMIIGGKYLYVPVFNVLSRSQKPFTDGVYMFASSVHDSGQLFINYKGTAVILRNESVSAILADYSNFLKNHQLAETKQIAYLCAIAEFMKFRHKD
jgi:hypothetical protein